MENIKISASHNRTTDMFVANISMNGNDFNESARNGSDLPKKVKKLTGIDIVYNYNQMTYEIPAENQFN